MNISLPPGHFGPPGECPRCRRRGVEVSRIEGLPIYVCPRKCGEQAIAGALREYGSWVQLQAEARAKAEAGKEVAP
jgi:hypothetical protein